MNLTNILTGGAIFAATLQGAIVTVFPHPEDPPPVELVGLEVVGQTVIYHRIVHGDQVIRAPYAGSLVEVKTERAIPECDVSGSADYGPNEGPKQDFDFAIFYSADCAGALTEGVEYRPFAAVTPIVGKPDTIYGTPFIWQGN